MNLGFASVKIIALGVLVTVLGAFTTYNWYTSIAKAEKAVETRLNASYKDKLLEAAKEAQKKEKELNDVSYKNLEEKNQSLHDINRQLSIDIASLHNRPVRPSPSDSSKVSPITEACTARELYREDAEFLTREASRADGVRIERDYYYQQYEDARKIINGNAE